MRTLEEFWDWAWHEGKDASVQAPDRIHAKFPYPEAEEDVPARPWAVRRRGTQRATSPAIVGPPFTKAFMRYLEGGRLMTPIRRALVGMRPQARCAKCQEPWPCSAPTPPHAKVAGGPWSLELRIAWAIVEGGYSTPEGVAEHLRCRPEIVRRAGLTALRLLHYRTQEEIAAQPKRELPPGGSMGRERTGAPLPPHVGTSRSRRPDRVRAAS